MAKMTPEQAAKNRERQRKWRERAFKDPDGHLLTRVNVALGSHAAASLKRLSEGYSLTHRELFERLLIAANTAVSESLMGKGAWRFEDGKLEPGALGAFNLAVTVLAPNATGEGSEALDGNESIQVDAGPTLDLEPSPTPVHTGRVRYRAEIKAQAVRMRDAGEGRLAIVTAIANREGHAPDVTNINRLIEKWRHDPDVMALLGPGTAVQDCS